MPVYPMDDVTPWTASDSAPVRWNTGWAAYVVASSKCVRLNRRGIHAKPAYWTLISDLRAEGWWTRTCHPGAEGLCTYGNQTAFPMYPKRPTYNPFATPLGGAWLGCSREEDGRVLDAHSDGYDPSPCDVIDGGWDVVFSNHTLAIQHTAMDTWAYWTLCILVVCIVRSLSYLVVARLKHGEQDKKAPEPPNTKEGPMESIVALLLGTWTRSTNTRTTFACLLIWALCLIPTLNTIYVTVEEQIFVTTIALYIPAYTILWYMSTHAEDPPLYNLIVASILLATTRLYAGVETPYVSILTWGIGTRTLMKIRNTYWSRIVAVTVILDAFLLTLMSVLGLTCDPPYQVLIGALALLASDTLQIS